MVHRSSADADTIKLSPANAVTTLGNRAAFSISFSCFTSRQTYGKVTCAADSRLLFPSR